MCTLLVSASRTSWRFTMPFYAVRNGRKPGIYQTWPSCESQVKKFPNACYKRFPTYLEALQFVKGTNINTSEQVPCKGMDETSDDDLLLAEQLVQMRHGSQQLSETEDQMTDSNIKQVSAEDVLKSNTVNETNKHAIHNVNEIKGLQSQLSILMATATNSKDKIQNFTSACVRKLHPVESKLIGLLGTLEKLKSQTRELSLLLEKQPLDSLTNGNENQQKMSDEAEVMEEAYEEAIENQVGDDNIKANTTKMKKGKSSRKRKAPDVNDEEEPLVVWTDGACPSNGKDNARAGIGVYWGIDNPMNVSERLPGRQTVNRAEIHAACRAIEQVKSLGRKNVDIYTDSKFLVDSMTKWIHNWKKNGWKKADGKKVINIDDFMVLDALCQDVNVKWVHIPAHRGIPGNEAADKLAVAGAAKPYTVFR